MKPTNSQRDEVFETATPAQRFLYAHYSSGASLSKLAQKYHITDAEQYKIFAIIVGDVTLGFYEQDDIAALLQIELNFDPTTARSLALEVEKFLAPINDPAWQPPAEAADEYLTDENQSLVKEISSMEEVLTTLPQVRTMATDRHGIAPLPPSSGPVYTSTQSAILREGK